MPGNEVKKHERAKGSVVFLFTTFPVLSETFLQREVSVLKGSGLPMRVVSLWGGEQTWQGLEVERFGFRGVLLGLFHLPFWLLRAPHSLSSLLSLLWRPRSSGLLNWAENLLGLCYGMASARKLQQAGVTHFHAVWASAPAMAALTLHRLTGIPFTCAAHAYDLFEKGGDGWIKEKLADAQWVRTSTNTGAERLLELGASEERIQVVRRGLSKMPPFGPFSGLPRPVRILSVGRMVEKMGFGRQIPVFQKLSQAGVPLEVTWIGDGPLRTGLEKAVREAGLSNTVQFSGACPYGEVEQAYASNALFFFTGQVDSRGDRAGLPNAVAEAMAWGLPVFATRVGAVGEAVSDGVTGFLWEDEPAADRVLEVLDNSLLLETVRAGARDWVETHFDAARNLGPLIAYWKGQL